MYSNKKSILVIGALGQIGTELTAALRLKYGVDAVTASDRHPVNEKTSYVSPYVQLNVLDKAALQALVQEKEITHIYHLAAVLSATGEQNPLMAWDINMQGLLNVLEVAREEKLEQIFWPSSIAVFGPDAPKADCPQDGVTNPSTVYGISKIAGEQWCRYYFEKYGLDVRSVRYPGLISYSAPPGGGTTDYAVAIFHEAIKTGSYECFLAEDTRLPMLYMDDAIRATLELMDAPAEHISIRTSYNLSGLSFSAAELAAEIQKHIPELKVSYQPDSRQAIADSWPQSIDDTVARNDWGWKPKFDVGLMTEDMLLNLNDKYAEKAN
ncbi:nucleoside-diphosphate-sugar epimerase [Mucilaginibacter oryzae]|uniref:Nucleoside-diphosphate-sugar epimerase n=1 Tax=Mucilaginibacter oryzae TaxID=468058 RepID=A0A316HEE2_9SPHI|nr:NAD-dependent epimerase/dehydratase family protein [Mucilaginibacter oryzae]PWK78370.1 nucleoside-diphosphate-sugar epimerase [Mucilaginibacter oryzae]